MRTRVSAPICLVLAVAAATVGRGAPAPQDVPATQGDRDQSPAVFRAETNFIRVDMFATGPDGAFVEDLRPDEVEVFEDGVRQDVLTFEYVDVSAGGEGPSAGDDSRSRVYVVFIDTFTTGLRGESELRLSLVQFLDRLLGPSDLVGLMTPDTPVTAVTLGDRSSVISDLANDVRWLESSASEREDLQEFAWESCYPRSRGSGRRFTEMKARRDAKYTIDALHDLVWYLRDLREERKAVLFVTAGWPFVDDFTLETGGNEETRECAQDRRMLSRIDYKDLLREVTDVANRANVSFYPVSSREAFEPPRQLRAPVRNRLRQQDRRQRDTIEDQLTLLARNTDGMVEVNGDLNRVAERIIADTSSYYLMGYQSTNDTEDGAFRNITVRVTRPGVSVRARRGYGGETPALRLSGVAAEAPRTPAVDGRIVDALLPVERFDSLAPFWGRLSAWEPGDEGGAFWFVGELGQQVRSEAPWSSGATAEVVVLDASKTEVVSRSFDIEPNRTAFMLRVPADGGMEAGTYSVRVHLRPRGDEGPNVHDASTVTLEAETNGVGQAVMWRRAASAVSDYFMTADPRFRRTERIRLELPTRSNDPVTARLLDRFGQPLQVPATIGERADASREFHWIVIDMPLAALAPAYYTFEVIQGGGSRFTSFQIVP